jgi:hypothetical protein
MTHTITYATRRRPGDPRLGRHRVWDSRNDAYVRNGTPTYTDVEWQRFTAIMDQGQLGSCTGNAVCGLLGCQGLYEDLSGNQQAGLVESQAVAFYSLATQLDGYSGTYPPTDTGSDGPSAAKAAMQLGYATGYVHATTFPGAVAAVEKGAGMAGTNWYQGMFTPDANGVVSISKRDTVAGGHEYVVRQIDAKNELVWCDNSWGTSFGVGGRFAMSFTTFERLITEDGDFTTLVPLQSAPPTPVPPTPPVPSAVTGQQAADAAVAAWRALGLSA